MKLITLRYLKSISACSEAVEVFKNKYPKGASADAVFKALIPEKLDWANWLIARILDRKNRIRYAIYAAEQVLEIFEKKYPDDKRPRLAIEAARAVVKKDTMINCDAAYAAAYATNAAAYATNAAAYAATKKKIIMHGIKLLRSQR